MFPETIRKLDIRSRDLDICAAWRHDAFLRDDGYSLADSRDQLLKIDAGPDGFEVALVAHVGDEPAGICMLVREELDAHHDVSPWLASLFVAPAFRQRGIAGRLIGAIEAHATARNASRLHLYTVDAVGLYQSCGWAVAERLDVSGFPLIYMVKDLD